MIKKRVLTKVLCLAALGVVLSPVRGQTLNEILKKMVQTQGGPETLKSIKDMTLAGSIDIVQQGLTGSLTIYKKEPDKRRTDIEVMGMLITQAYDGKTAWWINPQTGSTEELSGRQADDLKRQALPAVANLEPSRYGLSFNLKGRETVEGKEYLVVEEVFPDGLKAALYVDPATYLTERMRANVTGETGAEVQIEQIMSDFKKEGNMTMAHSIVTYQNGAEYTRISISSVKFNTGLEDSLFIMGK
jgi:outer membrane lipoprotein-sorting protein